MKEKLIKGVYAIFTIILVVATICLYTAINVENAEAASKIHLKETTVNFVLKNVSEQKTFSQTLYTASDKKISNSKIVWSSNNKKVATVSKFGKITPKSGGTATITAKYKGKKYSCKVSVSSVTIENNNIKMAIEGNYEEKINVKTWLEAEYVVENVSGPYIGLEYNQKKQKLTMTAKEVGTSEIKIYNSDNPKDCKYFTVEVYKKVPVNVDVSYPSYFTLGDSNVTVYSVQPLMAFSGDKQYVLLPQIKYSMTSPTTGNSQYGTAYFCAYNDEGKILNYSTLEIGYKFHASDIRREIITNMMKLPLEEDHIKLVLQMKKPD